MAIDPQRIGIMAAEFMETLETQFGEDATISTVAFIAAIDHGPAQGMTTIHYSAREGDGGAAPQHVVRGLLAEVDRGITRE